MIPYENVAFCKSPAFFKLGNITIRLGIRVVK